MPHTCPNHPDRPLAKNMNRKHATTHPAPWKVETWTTVDGQRYRVIDALNNPIGLIYCDLAEIQQIVEARNEDLSEQILDLLKVHEHEIKQLTQMHVESDGRSRKEITRLENLLRSANFPELDD